MLRKAFKWNQNQIFSKSKGPKIYPRTNFWKAITPFYSDKWQNSKKKILKEGFKFIKNKQETGETMNKYFVNKINDFLKLKLIV